MRCCTVRVRVRCDAQAPKRSIIRWQCTRMPRDKQAVRCDFLHVEAEREESLAPSPEPDAIGA